MKKIKYIFPDNTEDVTLKEYPKDFNRKQFLGMETRGYGRYFKVNWATSENDFIFWYPFVGGKDVSVYTQVKSKEDLQRLLKDGCTFWSFDSAEELYGWMARIGEKK